MPVSLSNPTLSPNSPTATVLGWLKQAMGLPTAELHIKLRGNILHVLCETPAALDQSAVLLKLVRSLIEGGDDLVRQHYPQVYQLYVYSRLEGNPTPEWTAPIYLNRLERHLAQLVLENQDEADIKATHSLLEKYNQGQSARGVEGGSGAIVLSNLSLARKGDPEAIAWYLSETLSSLDVGVWVSIKAIPGTAHLHRMAIPVGLASRIAGDDGEATADDPAGTDTTISRLWILCEATYSPDPSLIARPTAERLRQLQLTQFKDAVLLLQVRGETKPDWSLRIDLTPPEEMLREWGRWGDTDAIARLLSAAVASWHLGVTAELTNGTLHLICSPQSGDHDTQQAEGLAAQEAVLEALTTPLNDLAPQGIPRAVIYGQAGANATPAWVQYLDLPAAEHSALADTPEYLGQTGDLPAIAFLLTRLLNPSLDDRLATGGQRVQLLRRDGLLHVMVDGPVAPRRRLVAPPINDYLHSLSPMGIEGVRIYGRRSGQSQPAWTFGQDFLARRRLVPEATPEFTASDSYVNELLVRPDGPVTAAEIEAELEEDVALSQWVQDVLAQGRHLLLRSQLLTSATPDLGDGVESLDNLGRSDGFKIAVVWAAVGVLVALQVDWLLGQIITPPSQQAKAEDIAPPPTEAPLASDPLAEDLAELDWPGSQSSDNGWGEGGFTSDSNGDTAGAQSLDTSPSQPIVAINDLVEQASFSSFNSDQMNEKLALYYQRLEQSGPPDVMIVGSSRALRGVDPVALRQELATIGYDNVSIFNFGINGATAQVVDLVIRQVLEPDQLPQLIIWADGARAFNSGRVDATYNAIAASPGYREVANRRAEELEAVATPGDPTTPGSPETSTGSLPKSYAAMDEWLSGRLATVSAVYADRDRLKGWFQQQLMVATPTPTGSSEEGLDAAMPEGSTIDFDGFLALSVRFNPATYYQDFARVSGRYDGDYDSFRLEGQQVEAFANLLSFTQEQDIPIVFINTPLTDEYLDDYRRDAEAEFLQHMLKLSTTETGFLFRDFAQLWPDRYDYFSDPSHLNRYGAYQVSSQLGQDPLIAWPRPATPPAPPALP
ncbi:MULTISPECIES: DUF1574 domain-containing protein [Cyanophyceae]|uniref:DUF1574 domain-containing protein n=1 Tax=Leptolyngbya subtilissima DQ-A4 TaxID=2933933 RepID=A0ABV0K5U6_9CYAN|nr:DUF1574 domain-containing protein [Nodosilinea sp. FACHB-141]MBD2114365.1 DUF1574 domain-containing protein [Nodosilinea sp. FACHB-141]